MEELTPQTFLENIEDKQKLEDLIFLDYLSKLSRKELRKHLKPEARFSNRIKKQLNKKK
jgi:hypothetical protein